MSSPRLSDESANRILQRAIQLADERGASTTLADLRDTAQQLGVAPEFVERAVLEMMDTREDRMDRRVAQDQAPTPWWHLDGKERTWLWRLVRYGALAACLPPTVRYSTKLAYALPYEYWQYQGIVEGLCFGLVYLVLGRLVRVPFAQVVGAFFLVVHVALAGATALNRYPGWSPNDASDAATVAAILTSAATALWFRWRSKNHSRRGSCSSALLP